MKEKYEPTPEEVKKAEEQMTPSEKELSEKRKGFVEIVRHGVESKDNPFVAKLGGELKDRIEGYEGTLGGHRFNLDQSGGRLWGSVDGMELPPEAVRKLYEKYGLDAFAEAGFRIKTSQLEKAARYEVTKEIEEQKKEEEKKEEGEKQVGDILRDLEEKGLI